MNKDNKDTKKDKKLKEKLKSKYGLNEKEAESIVKCEDDLSEILDEIIRIEDKVCKEHNIDKDNKEDKDRLESLVMEEISNNKLISNKSVDIIKTLGETNKKVNKRVISIGTIDMITMLVCIIGLVLLGSLFDATGATYFRICTLIQVFISVKVLIRVYSRLYNTYKKYFDNSKGE